MISFGRVLLLVKKESLFFIRGKKFIFLILAMLALGALQIGFHYAFDKGAEFDLYRTIFSTYITFNNFILLAMVGILAGVICGEKEKKTWSFYFTKTFTKTEIVIAKILFYNILMLVTMFIVWTVLIAYQYNFLGGNSIIEYDRIIYTVLISSASIFFIVNLEIFISGIVKKTSIAALSIIIMWIVIMLVNILVPAQLGRGYLAPFVESSLQTSVVNRLMGLNDKIYLFESFTNYPTMGEIIRAITYAVIEGIVLITGAILFTRRESKA